MLEKIFIPKELLSDRTLQDYSVFERQLDEVLKRENIGYIF